jgi:hypothetical protein
MWPWTKIGAFFTAAGVIGSFIFSWITFNAGLNQYKEINRPYVGIDDKKINVTIDYEDTDKDGLRVNPALNVPVTIRNYGKLPAYFTASYSGEYGDQVKPFQVATNYILPDQEIELKWDELLPTEIDNTDPCKSFEKVRITISYGEIGQGEEYMTVASPKILDLPLNSKTAKKDYSGWCWYDKDQNHKYVYDWSIDEMK